MTLEDIHLSGRSRSLRQEQAEEAEAKAAFFERMRTIAIVIGVLFAIAALWGFLATRSYTLTIDRGDSIASALNAHYGYPAPTATALLDRKVQKRMLKVNLQTIAIAKACKLNLDGQQLGERATMRYANYELAERAVRDSGRFLVSSPMQPGDAIKVGMLGGYTCTPGSRAKPFASR
jgi:hypothetical protein